MARRIAFAFCVIGVLVFMSVVQAQDPSGIPGVDYPNYLTIPKTSFKCSDQKFNPGFYADLETKCQAFHFCYQDRQESFLCPTGTIFNQAMLTCDVWYRSNCSIAQLFYNVNTGPIMERAGKNLPMLLRLRNRSQTKPSIQTSTDRMFDKVSSLYEAKETRKTSSISKDSDLKIKTSDKSMESYPSDFNNKDNEQLISDNHELGPEKDPNEETGTDQILSDETDMNTDLVYDHVDDGYYRSYGQQGDWDNSESASEKFNKFYDYRDTDNEYGEDESQIDYVNEESFEDSDLTVTDYSGYPKFTRRSYQPGRSRVRRKPLYVVLDDQPEVHAQKTTEAHKLDLDNSESREGKQMNLTEQIEEATPSPEPFPRPTAIPHSQLNISSETPMTSEEFESAIWTDLILPGIPDDYEGPILNVPVDNQGTSTESQSDMQSDDETIYIENDMEPENYVPYVSQYENVAVIPEQGDAAYVESYSESQQEDLSDTDDTFVVIPDEYDDNAVDSESYESDFDMETYPEETAYRTQMFQDRSPVVGYSSYGNAYDYSSNTGYPQNYQQAVDYNPEITAGMYREAMQNDQGYDYDSGYEMPPEMPVDYVNSNVESENIYTETEIYPYEERELGVNERPLQQSMSEDLHDSSNEEFVYILDDQPEVETWEPTEASDNSESSTLVESETREGKEMNLTSEVEEATPRPEPFPRPTAIPHSLLNISSETPLTSEEFESAIWTDLILPGIPDDYEGPILNVPVDNQGTSAHSGSQSNTQSDDETIYIKNDLEVADTEQNMIDPGQESGQSDVYYVFDFDEKSDSNETKRGEDSKLKESFQEKSEVDENHGSELVNSSNEYSSSDVSLDKEGEKQHLSETDNVWSPDVLVTSKSEQIKSPDVEPINTYQMNSLSGSEFGKATEHEILTPVTAPFSTNMGNFDFSTDSRFLNHMGYSESMDFGPYGFGPNMGQFSMMESMQQSRPSNAFSERLGQTQQSNLSPLSAIQEKMRSMKQGKFGAFKKYMSSRN